MRATVNAPDRKRVLVLILGLILLGGTVGLVPSRATAFDPREPMTWANFEETGREPYCQEEPICVAPLRILSAFGDGSGVGVWLPHTYRPFQQTLSPDGRRVAFRAAGDSLWVMERGGVPQEIYSTDGILQTPHWSSDGTKLIFDEGWDIKTINADGSGLKTVIRWRGTQAGGDFSPNGSRITFSSAVDSKGKDLPGGMQVFTASAVDGSSPVQVTRATSQFTDGYAPVYSPDGNSIAFEGSVPTDDNPAAFQSQIHTIGVDGNFMKRLTFGVRSSGWNRDSEPAWSPDGQYVVFKTTRASPTSQPKYTAIFEIHKSGLGGVNPLFINTQHPITGSAPGLETPTPRRHSSSYTLNDYLAHEFRPILRYDSGETYRPLDVDKFFGERNDLGEVLHQICTSSSCAPLASKASLPNNASAYIDVAGNGNADTYHSPYNACTEGDLRDCDTGIRSALYYWVTSPAQSSSYYHDYWIFYRYNDWPFLGAPEGSDHEGDWESVTIASSSGNRYSFDFASFSQHGHWFSYLRENLSCGGFGVGSCGTTASPSGRRLDVYVSNGSHANYADQCDEDIFTSCPRNDTPFIADGSRNGEELWGNDGVGSALLRFPAPGDLTNWGSYPGDWGAPPEFGPNGPAHGANAGHFYSPWISDCASGNSDCPGVRPSASSSEGTASVRRNDQCDTWFGTNVVAAACDTQRVRAALARRSISGPGAFELSFVPRPGATSRRPTRRGLAVAPGLAQAVGRPLRPGESMALSGRAPAGTQLLVRAQTKRGQTSARFSDLGLEGGGRALIRVVRRGAWPSVRLTRPDGSTVRPEEVRRTVLRVPASPRITRIARRGQLLEFRYNSPGDSALLDVSARRHGEALKEKAVLAGSRRTVMRLPKGAAYLRMVGVYGDGARSNVRIVAIPRS